MADEQPHLESRVAKIESHVAHLDSTVTVIQFDLRELRREMSDGFQTLETRLSSRIDALGNRLSGKSDAPDGKHDDKFEALRKERGGSGPSDRFPGRISGLAC